LETDLEIIQKLAVKDLQISDQGVTFSKIDRLQSWLAEEIRMLIDGDFERLMNVLYRIDVGEDKVKTALSGNDPAFEIAGLIIERELKKVETRRKYGSSG
jgi:hypothetical protein